MDSPKVKKSSQKIVRKHIPNGLKNIPIKLNIEVPRPPASFPPHLFKLHTLMMFSGARNSGKTNSCILLIKEYLKHKSFTRTYIISPTYESNPQFTLLQAKSEDVYTDPKSCQEALTEIIRKNEADWGKYKKEEVYREAYNRWIRHKYTLRDQILLETQNFRAPSDIPMPSACVVIDDMSHSDIYSSSKSNPFINLCLRHRHMGITLCMLVQTFKSGVPKALRQNIQQLFIWKTYDTTTLMALYEEFGNICSFGEFLEVFDLATAEQHHFLTVDPYNPNPAERFRRDFDEFIQIPKNHSYIQSIIKREKKKFQLEDNESDAGDDRPERGGKHVA